MIASDIGKTLATLLNRDGAHLVHISKPFPHWGGQEISPYTSKILYHRLNDTEYDRMAGVKALIANHTQETIPADALVTMYSVLDAGLPCGGTLFVPDFW